MGGGGGKRGVSQAAGPPQIAGVLETFAGRRVQTGPQSSGDRLEPKQRRVRLARGQHRLRREDGARAAVQLPTGPDRQLAAGRLLPAHRPASLRRGLLSGQGQSQDQLPPREANVARPRCGVQPPRLSPPDQGRRRPHILGGHHTWLHALDTLFSEEDSSLQVQSQHSCFRKGLYLVARCLSTSHDPRIARTYVPSLS